MYTYLHDMHVIDVGADTCIDVGAVLAGFMDDSDSDSSSDGMCHYHSMQLLGMLLHTLGVGGGFLGRGQTNSHTFGFSVRTGEPVTF
jgi:hypothetical protein